MILSEVVKDLEAAKECIETNKIDPKYIIVIWDSLTPDELVSEMKNMIVLYKEKDRELRSAWVELEDLRSLKQQLIEKIQKLTSSRK